MVEDRNIKSLTNVLRALRVRVDQVENQLRELRQQEAGYCNRATEHPNERRPGASHQQGQTTSKLARTLGQKGHREQTQSDGYTRSIVDSHDNGTKT